MGILSDVQLRERGPELLTPFDPKLVQPASIDVHLDSLFYVTKPTGTLNYFELDPSCSNEFAFEGYDVAETASILLHPNTFMLGSTTEVVSIPNDLVARFEGKSSLGRLGLLTHITAGFIDPGFVGHITLELKNVTRFPIRLYPGMRIGQLCFEELSVPAAHTYGDPIYGSHYQGQRGPTLSKSYLSFEIIDVHQNSKEN